MRALASQASMDRYVYNRLLAAFKEEYRCTGMVNTSLHRINSWYTALRNETGPRWLKRSISSVTRQTLYDLGRHYSQYAETEYMKAAGKEPYPEYGEPHFKRYGNRISIPLRITHDNTQGDARFISDRIIRISKMGEIKLSRPFPTPNYRPKTARMLQTADCKWRIVIACRVPDPEPHNGTPVILGIDRNIGNIATPDHILVPPQKMVRRMANAERAASRAQHIASRRQRPDSKSHKPGSRRWAKAARRAAKQKRRAANIRNTTTHKQSRIIADNATHAAFENLQTQNMTKSAKSTAESPGRNVAQKSGLNRSILNQNWGSLARLTDYKLVGHIILVAAAYTSQKCSLCGFVDACNRDGREFLCLLCRHVAHADNNAASNIEDGGARNLGPPAKRGSITLRRECMVSNGPATHAGSAHVKGRLDAEGSGVSLPVNRQAPTGVWPPHVVVLWRDV